MPNIITTVLLLLLLLLLSSLGLLACPALISLYAILTKQGWRTRANCSRSTCKQTCVRTAEKALNAHRFVARKTIAVRSTCGHMWCQLSTQTKLLYTYLFLSERGAFVRRSITAWLHADVTQQNMSLPYYIQQKCPIGLMQGLSGGWHYRNHEDFEREIRCGHLTLNR